MIVLPAIIPQMIFGIGPSLYHTIYCQRISPVSLWPLQCIIICKHFVLLTLAVHVTVLELFVCVCLLVLI